MFITAICVLFLVKLRWPKNKSLYVTHAVYFSFKKGRLMYDHSCAIIPPLSLEYYEAKIQKLLMFSWKPALEMPRYVEIQISYFYKRALRSKATGIVAENSRNSTKSGKCRHLRYEENLIKSYIGRGRTRELTGLFPIN